MKNTKDRKNIFPIISDANHPEEFGEFIEQKVDSLYQDIAQRNQADIFVKNSFYLKKGGLGALVIKVKSISQTKSGEEVLKEQLNILTKEFEILQVINLEPFEKDHYLVLVKK